MEHTRVVVFEIFPKHGKILLENLKALQGVEVIENEVNNTEEALEFIFREKPDVVILGNDFPGVDGFYFTQVICREAAPTQVIMTAEVVTAEAVRQAMRAGACDFLSYKKLNLEELSMAIEHASELAYEGRRKKERPVERVEAAPRPLAKAEAKHPIRTVVVYSSKSGAGVSTLTANLGCALAAKKNKVLVVDADFLFGDMEVLLNQRSNNSISDLVRFKDNLEEDVIKVVINQGSVDLIAAPSNAVDALEITGPIFEKILVALQKQDYDYLLINTNTYLSDSTVLAMEKADQVILVGTQEIATVRALSMFLDLASTLRLDASKFMLVINKFQTDSMLSVDRLTKRLEMEISLTIPYDFVSVLQANNLGIPFVNGNDRLPVSRAVFELARLADEAGNGKASLLSGATANLKKNLAKKKKS